MGCAKDNTGKRYNIIINEELENDIDLSINANSKLMNGKKYRNARKLRDYETGLDEMVPTKNKLINEYNY